MRVIELRDERSGLVAFVVIDHELFGVAAGGTRMLPDVGVYEVARLARAMTWKFAACRVPYAGAKAGIRFAGGDRAAVIGAYRRAGARLVGVSTVDGVLADRDGLDVEELLALRERHGDRLVAHGPRPVRPREELFELECDVLVPGAQPDSITREVAARVRCAVVAPAANVPYGQGAVEQLHRRGIIAVPDFIANAGGIHLYTRVAQDDSPPDALAHIEALIQEAV